MLEKVNEISIWEYLKFCHKPIILYGTGNGADIIIKKLSECEIKYDDIFASESFVRGQIFHGIRVKTYKDIINIYGNDIVILVCFASENKAVLDYIKYLSDLHTVLSPSVPIFNEDIFTINYILEREQYFDEAFAALSDDESRNTFINILKYKISGKIEYLFNCEVSKQDVFNSILKLGNEEYYLDCGAYNGDTVFEFISQVGDYRRIYAIEPDIYNYKKLSYSALNLSAIEIINAAVSDFDGDIPFNHCKGRNSHVNFNSEQKVPCLKIDTILNDRPVTYIKMDIEGSEFSALNGAKSTLKKYKPKLYVCGYHKNEDIYRIPLKIREINPDYKIYFRHFPYIPCWESNFYCT